MTDQLDFETRLEERLCARAALASRPFDATAIAHRVVAVDRQRRRSGKLGWPSVRPAPRLLAVALLLAMAVLGAIAGVGALLRERPLLPLPIASNGVIAVSANPAGVDGGEMGDIYLVGDGTAARRIIGAQGDDVAQACPSFSPDGRRLAYGEARASGSNGTFRGVWPAADRAVVLVVLNDDGETSGSSVRVAVSEARGEIPCPKWSPDGRHVAFRSGNELWVANAASGETSVFEVRQASWGQQGLAWSRDGSLIAVSEPRQIRIVDVNTGDADRIPVEGATPASLGWTAGDARITYVTTDESGDGLTVNVVDLDGQNDTRLATGSADSADLQLRFHDAVVSPDGDRVAFVQREYRRTSDGGDSGPIRLFTIDLDGSNVVQVPTLPDFGVQGLQWSPDGQRLLFGSIDGVASVAASPGSAAIVHSRWELNLEWSGSEVTWQPVLR